jgi:hypothetical protein
MVQKASGTTPVFGSGGVAPQRDERVPLKFEKIPGGGVGHCNRWTINGKSWPNANPLFTVQQRKRYRLLITNDSGNYHTRRAGSPSMASISSSGRWRGVTS